MTTTRLPSCRSAFTGLGENARITQIAAAQETASATQDDRGLHMDEKPKEQQEGAVETAKKVGRKIA